MKRSNIRVRFALAGAVICGLGLPAVVVVPDTEREVARANAPELAMEHVIAGICASYIFGVAGAIAGGAAGAAIGYPIQVVANRRKRGGNSHTLKT